MHFYTGQWCIFYKSRLQTVSTERVVLPLKIQTQAVNFPFRPEMCLCKHAIHNMDSSVSMLIHQFCL